MATSLEITINGTLDQYHASGDALANVSRTHKQAQGNVNNQVLAIEVGVRRPLGASVSGVVLLAGMEQAASTSLVENNRPRLERLGLATAEVLQRVEAARLRGHDHAPRGVVPGTAALAVPVHDGRQVVAAISIAAMADRLRDRRCAEVLLEMRQCARLIARRLHEVPYTSS